MAIGFLGIGSNKGDRAANLEKALGLLRENKEIEILAVSDFVETDPVGNIHQGKFLNGALKIKTGLLPLELLSQLKMIERRLGRPAAPEPNSPRPMDLDILFYDDVVIVEGKSLTIPHPRLAEREFVLKPLLQIAPDLVHPKLQQSIQELYDRLLCKS